MVSASLRGLLSEMSTGVMFTQAILTTVAIELPDSVTAC